MSDFLLVIDQGTTSTRAIIFDRKFNIITTARRELLQSFPQKGWVEHDPETIWQDVLATCREALQTAKLTAEQIAGIGITNQRETTVIWHRKTGKAIYPAIVWQDRRTAAYCLDLHNRGLTDIVQKKTGLLLDPYFSATKIHWILQNVVEARQLAEKGDLAFGTIESFLLWHLTGGVHASDITNAARTLLFNIETQTWDERLLQIFEIPPQLLPQVRDNKALFGETIKSHFGAAIPIVAMMGDQQAAAFGQACFEPNHIKSTYGTGCFVLMNTGEKIVQSGHRLLSTVAYRIDNKITYALEGSIFVAGAAVQWLRDAMHLIKNADETESIVTKIDSTDGVYLVPAFTGLGAPYWDPLARGAILGLTRDSGVNHIVRAALESVCYQTCDLLEAMQADVGSKFARLRVDGGMANNNWLMQFLSDILQIPIERPAITETTALGTAFVAGLQLKWLNSLDEISTAWQCEKLFTPNMSLATSESLYQGWREAISRIRGSVS
jgi:glycerol kinase